jgi:hypothetical protein
MWPAWVVAAIALSGASFMVRFLVALLREGAPPTCYWVVPIRRDPEKQSHLKALGGIYFDNDAGAAECNRDEDYLEFLENEGHAKKEYDSGLIALDVRTGPAYMGWRAIQPSRGNVFREQRRYFGCSNRTAGNAG